MSKQRIFEVYQHLRDYEAGFDRAQADIRRAASIWILAAFGAMSYLLSAQYLQFSGGDELLPLGFLGVLVCFASILGLFLLWYIDQNVYQRLLHSVFVYGCAIEASFDNVPQIRRAMHKANLNVSNKLGRFYKIPIIVLLILMLFFMCISISSNEVVKMSDLELPESLALVFELILLFSGVVLLLCVFHGENQEKDLFDYYGEHYDEDVKIKLFNFRHAPVPMIRIDD